MEIEITRASLKELSELQEICRETYSIYFSTYWENNGLDLYLENQFGTKNLKADLNKEAIAYYFITLGKQAIGFIKINLEAALKDFEAPCEIEKMYIYPNFKAKGIGKHALSLVLRDIRRQKKTTLFLDVLSDNATAISFYKKQGFKFLLKTKVLAPDFKATLNNLDRMVLELNK